MISSIDNFSMNLQNYSYREDVTQHQMSMARLTSNETSQQALNDFFFDSQFGMKLYSLDHETKYYVPKTFKILTLNLPEESENL